MKITLEQLRSLIQEEASRQAGSSLHEVTMRQMRQYVKGLDVQQQEIIKKSVEDFDMIVELQRRVTALEAKVK